MHRKPSRALHRKPSRMRLIYATLALIVPAVLASYVVTPPAQASISSLTGATFRDDNRNGTFDPGEVPLANQHLYVFNGAGGIAAQAVSDADGRYAVDGLAPGDYMVSYDPDLWWNMRTDLVPTTTGSLRPEQHVTVTDTGRADFGWRPIVRSKSVDSPIDTFTGPNGLRVESFNDVVPARAVYDSVMRGGVGDEAPFVTIRFDYRPDSYTAISYVGSPGSYQSFRAVCYDNWLTWLGQGDWGVSHEYGHAWSYFRNTVVRQEGNFASYLRARGLSGDPRVGSSYAWRAEELIAEDYRQLLGSSTARVPQQTNSELPPASAVPGLRDFLVTTFSTADAPAPEPGPAPTAALSVTAPTVNPAPVVKSAVVTSSVSGAALISIEIRDAKGSLVRSILSGASRPAGWFSATWDRKSTAGKRVRSGAYTVSVTASASGSTVTETTPFTVS
jgi:hypothetical protein